VALAQAGAAVFCNDINPDKVDQVVEAIITEGGKATAWMADVSNKLLVGPMIEAVRDAYGKITILINAAGVEKKSSLYRLDEWDWRRSLEVNLSGAFFVTQMAGRVMADEGGGIIINLASTAGHTLPRVDSVAYVASKAGLIGLTKEAARELAIFNVRVNAVCPANIDLSDENWHPPATLDHIPQRRLGRADEVAQVILFLCSDAASFITGQAIHVDGGESMA
jgi:NAD(P)-dependent dehydrogenase (short-subunit alcohol dehydrogenase family)